MAEDQSEDSLKEWAEDNFEAVSNKIEQVTSEMRNNKPQENINVRKVDTEEGEKVVVEYSVQRWYDIKYFQKMLENTEESEDTVF